MLLAAALGGATAFAASTEDRCSTRDTAGTNCQEGNGRQTPGGGEKVSHAGWPKITGILWKVETAKGRTYTGTADNDELLSHHRGDRIDGAEGDDVIWGDWDPEDNNTWQRDRLNGQGGDDWIYASHGTNTIKGGKGDDFVYAYYGHGTIDCGPGKGDRAKIRLETGQYTVKNCERILNFCVYGSIGDGTVNGTRCRRPGE